VRRLALLIVLLAGLVHSSGAFAHASLVRAEPPDGAMLAEPPTVLRLTFNEPVSPLVMRLIGPSGEVITPATAAENSIVTVAPPRLRQGTHVLSWRVVSADGHPVGGSLMFSVGTATQPVSGPQSAGNPLVQAALWAAKLVIYAALFVGIGGAFFSAWFDVPLPNRARASFVALLAAGLFATVLSVGLQGLDALELPLIGLAEKVPWQTGLETAYGLTAITAAFALFAGIVSIATTSPRVAQALSLVGILGIGLALSLSGHAGTVEPRWLTRSAVFLHAVCIAFWIGAFVPLVVALRTDAGRGPLARFTHLIPYPLAVLVVTGTVLAIVQLDRIDALWTTRYGTVLVCKLAAVAALLALAAANRYRLVPRFDAKGAVAARPLAASIKIELALALCVLALVALWRFTPPPRALAAAEQVAVHVHGERAMAQIEFEPVRARGAKVSVLLLDAELRPLAAKELTLVFANPAAGIEPVRRNAVSEGEANWRIDDLRIPVAGRWLVRVEILISDFDKVTLEDQVELRRMP
jgi:copper transport protein